MNRLYRSYPDFVCLEGGQKTRALLLSSGSVLQTLGSSSGSERTSLATVLMMGVGRCWAENLFPVPESGGCFSPAGAASFPNHCRKSHAIRRSISHCFHPISVSNFSPYIRGLQRKINKHTLEAKLDISREGEFLVGFVRCPMEALKCEADPKQTEYKQIQSF